MKTTFVIPLSDTESRKFEFEGNLSSSEYSAMLMDNFRQNYHSVNNLVHSIQDGTYRNTNEHTIEVEDRFIFSTTEAVLLDNNYEDISLNYLDGLVASGKKFILNINIIPSSMDDDTQEEMNYWLDDSDMVLNDETLDDKTRLASLPSKDFLIDTGTKIYELYFCRVLDIDYSDKRYPFSFTLLVNNMRYH